MANVLKMMMVEAIHSLRSAGLSCREIARRLGIHRETVSRHLRLCRQPVLKPASAPIFPAGSEVGVAGFAAPPGPEAAGFDPPTGSPRSQASVASPWLAWLLEQRERGLSAKRIHQDLLVEHSAAAEVSYDSVRRLLKKHGAARPVPFRRMESSPGFEAQVDFGTGAPIVGPDGRRRKTHVIRVVLSHSRRGHMAQTAAHLADHVIPPVPVRQWVISVPKRLRGFLADRPPAVAALTKIFLDEIERLLCAAAGGASDPVTPASARPRLGGISFLHRFGSALNRHVHLRDSSDRRRVRAGCRRRRA